MARRLENKTAGALDWSDEIESKSLLKLGYCNLTFTNKENTLEPIIKALGSVEVDGSIFKFDTDSTITGTYPEEGWVVVDNLGVPSFVEGGILPEFDKDKKGYYFSTGERIVLRLRYNYKVSISDEQSWITYNQDKRLKSLITNSWESNNAIAARWWGAATWGDGLFVLAGTISGRTSSIMTSPNGEDWTLRTTPSDSTLYDVKYANGLFVAVGGISTTLSARIITSPDGINWTTRYSASGATSNFGAIAYGNGIWTTMPASSVGNIVTSYDGITWTLRGETPSGFGFSSIAFGAGIFVACRVSSLIGGVLESGIMTSEDGINWIDRETPDNNWKSVTYGNGIFISISSATSSYITSVDGITWTTRDHGFYRGWQDVIFADGLFLAVSGYITDFSSGDPLPGQSTNNIITSFDGVNWVEREAPLPTTSYLAITFGATKFVGVGYQGSNRSDEKVLTSKLTV